MRSLREVVLILFGALGILALAHQALEPEALEAVAIPTTQRDVEVGEVVTSSPTFVLVPNSSVTIDNGSSARKVVVTFSAEARVTGGSIELGYSLDGAACFKQAGPTAFSANEAGDYEAATAVHVIPLGSGVHTIRPCFRSLHADLVRLRDRVLIAEGRTK
ncbi:MAG TPA: hypothetical protein VIC59_04260 [Gemmatimonadota bacterium]|jgi:hypothetical protein